MKQSVFFISVLVFSMSACKSSKTTAQAEQSHKTETANLPIETVVPESGDTLRVVVEFIVEKNGSIRKVKIVSSSGEPLIDAEALRIIKASPKWEPAKQHGKTLRVRYTLPMAFVLTDTEKGKEKEEKKDDDDG